MIFFVAFNVQSIFQYKNWKLNDIINWIYTLDNGRYKQYISQISKSFEESGVGASDLPDITRQDLHLSFGIDGFRDRIDLEAHFKRLRENEQKKQRSDQKQEI